MRKRTYSTGREKRVKCGVGRVQGNQTYIQMSLSGHNSTAGQRFVTDHGLLPHPLLTFIKISSPLSFFLTPEIKNSLINGSKTHWIAELLEMKKASQVVLRVFFFFLMRSTVHGTGSRAESLMCATITGNMFSTTCYSCSTSFPLFFFFKIEIQTADSTHLR